MFPNALGYCGPLALLKSYCSLRRPFGFANHRPADAKLRRKITLGRQAFTRAEPVCNCGCPSVCKPVREEEMNVYNSFQKGNAKPSIG